VIATLPQPASFVVIPAVAVGRTTTAVGTL